MMYVEIDVLGGETISAQVHALPRVGEKVSMIGARLDYVVTSVEHRFGKPSDRTLESAPVIVVHVMEL
jgi:hypothetical protein